LESSRRALFLREMGLSPVWRLRAGDGRGEHPGSGVAQPAQGNTPLPQTDAPGRVEASAKPEQGGRAKRILDMDWPQLREAVSECRSCELCNTRTNTVFGVGDEQADWLLVGEAPGAEEDARGEPFVGQAGRLLDNMLGSIGLKRGANVYIANVLKCRPPGNRNPGPAEVAQCSPYLQRQIQLIQPKLIIAMGRFAAQTLLETDATIGSLRGKLHRYRGVPLIVSYHPAYLLRSLTEKAKAWEDLCFARRTMAGL
jgi:uracil-DNA glycosylase family 4